MCHYCFSSFDHGSIYRDIFNEASKVPSLRKLCVSQLPPFITRRDLEDLMNEFGSVRDVRVVMDHANRECKGYGYVEMNDAESASRALDANITLSGHTVSVSLLSSEDGIYFSLHAHVEDPFARGRESYSKSYHEDSHSHHDPYDRRDSHDHRESRARSHHDDRDYSRHDDRERSRHESRDNSGSSHPREARDSRQTLEQRRLFFRGAPYHVGSYDVEREFRRFVGVWGTCDVGRPGGVQSLHGQSDAPVEGVRVRRVPQRA